MQKFRHFWRKKFHLKKSLRSVLLVQAIQLLLVWIFLSWFSHTSGCDSVEPTRINICENIYLQWKQRVSQFRCMSLNQNTFVCLSVISWRGPKFSEDFSGFCWCCRLWNLVFNHTIYPLVNDFTAICIGN